MPWRLWPFCSRGASPIVGLHAVAEKGKGSPSYLRASGRAQAPPPQSPIYRQWCADSEEATGLWPPAPLAGVGDPGASRKSRGRQALRKWELSGGGETRRCQRTGQQNPRPPLRPFPVAATRKAGRLFSFSQNCKNSHGPYLKHSGPPPARSSSYEWSYTKEGRAEKSPIRCPGGGALKARTHRH